MCFYDNNTIDDVTINMLMLKGMCLHLNTCFYDNNTIDDVTINMLMLKVTCLHLNTCVSMTTTR